MNKNGCDLLEGSPLHLLHRIDQFATEFFMMGKESIDITPRQHAILATVATNEGVSQTDLVNLTGIDRSTVTDIVRRLTKKGFLRRRRSSTDGRAYSVKLTEKGALAVVAANTLATTADERILSPLAQHDHDQFIANLTTIVTAFDNTKVEDEAKSGL